MCDDLESSVLVVSENGYGKRSSIEDYRITNRGGKGVKTINVTDKTGELIALKNVTDENDLMVVNKSGITIRISVAELREMGRATQGVRIIKLREGDSIASVAKVPAATDEEDVEVAEVMENTKAPTTESTNDTPNTENTEE